MDSVSRSIFLALVCQSSVLVQGTSIRGGSSVSAEDVEAYDMFRNQFGRNDAYGSEHYHERLAFFAKRRAQVEAQNAKPDGTWWAKLNKFADITDSEYRAMLGYRRMGWTPASSAIIKGGSSFLQMDTLAASRDWRELKSGSFLRVQGGCGSCWAVAATGALEMHAELHKKLPSPKRLSFSQLLDCTPNPKHCGGDGGCSGATAELAFQYVHDHGIAAEDDYKDSEVSGKCRQPTSLLNTRGFVKLPENQLLPLLTTLSEKGPAVVSVDAEAWTMYDSGIFNGCQQDATINHAVLLVGYGQTPKGEKYWLIRNSWGADWGEGGYLRLLRHDGDEANGGHNGYCGTDYDPKDGVSSVGTLMAARLASSTPEEAHERLIPRERVFKLRIIFENSKVHNQPSLGESPEPEPEKVKLPDKQAMPVPRGPVCSCGVERPVPVTAILFAHVVILSRTWSISQGAPDVGPASWWLRLRPFDLLVKSVMAVDPSFSECFVAFLRMLGLLGCKCLGGPAVQPTSNRDLEFSLRSGWKHNLGQGASADLQIPEDMAERLAKVAASAVDAIGMRFCSVDIIDVEGEGLMVMEVNGGVMMDSLMAQMGESGKALAAELYEAAVLQALGR
ncbi:cpl-1 [Symbiodinium natans]|uniref:Cpl-1 protein n=1 Tax=Symbiodinium natans TaxID=878477 RepID=A0A812PKK6_9DINO|nr:cpl-1 [Symbiodinium natans]